jgi:hypothetical protein
MWVELCFLLLASVTWLQGYIRWDLFVLRAQPLDMSPLSLFWHNKMLVPAKLPQCSVISAWDSHNISWGIFWDCRNGDLSPPLLLGCIPRTAGRRSHQVPMDSLIQRRDFSSHWVGVKASDMQQNLVRCRNQRGKESTAFQNPGSKSFFLFFWECTLILCVCVNLFKALGKI